MTDVAAGLSGSKVLSEIVGKRKPQIASWKLRRSGLCEKLAGAEPLRAPHVY